MTAFVYRRPRFIRQKLDPYKRCNDNKEARFFVNFAWDEEADSRTTALRMVIDDVVKMKRTRKKKLSANRISLNL